MESVDKVSLLNSDASTMTSDPQPSALARVESGTSSNGSGTPFPLPSGLTFFSHRTGIFPDHPGPLMAGKWIRGVEVWPTLKAWIVHFCADPSQVWLDRLGSMGPQEWAKLEEPPGRLIEDPTRTIVFSMMFTWQGTVADAAARLMADPDFREQWGGTALPG